MPMKVREVIQLLETHGWKEIRSKGSHRHFKHPAQRFVITVPGNPGKEALPHRHRTDNHRVFGFFPRRSRVRGGWRHEGRNPAQLSGSAHGSLRGEARNWRAYPGEQSSVDYVEVAARPA